MAKPKKSMYYQFYYMAIQRFGKNNKIAEQISNILNQDEFFMGKRFHTVRKRLKIYLENQK